MSELKMCNSVSYDHLKECLIEFKKASNSLSRELDKVDDFITQDTMKYLPNHTDPDVWLEENFASLNIKLQNWISYLLSDIEFIDKKKQNSLDSILLKIKEKTGWNHGNYQYSYQQIEYLLTKKEFIVALVFEFDYYCSQNLLSWERLSQPIDCIELLEFLFEHKNVFTFSTVHKLVKQALINISRFKEMQNQPENEDEINEYKELYIHIVEEYRIVRESFLKEFKILIENSLNDVE